MRNRKFLFFVVCTCFLMPFLSHATSNITDNAEMEVYLEAEGEMIPYSEGSIEAQPKQSFNDVDFSAIESYGILEQAAGQGLGRQFFNSSKRSVMTGLIKAMPLSGWVVIQDLSNQVLLTQANASALENDVAVAPAKGDDLLTLRIEKLMERGFNREAYALFTRLSIDPYNEKIARFGIMSMFINGQKPLACVEMKTFDAPFKSEVFWQEIEALCTLSIAQKPLPEKQAILEASRHGIIKRIAGDKNFRMAYSPKSFSELSLLERSLLIATGRLDLIDLNENSIKEIPMEHIQALLALEPLDNKVKILLNARGVETGVISPYEFARVYTRIGRKAEKEKKPLIGLEHIATLYWKRADTFEPLMRQASMAEVFEHSKTYGHYLLIPFLEEISKLTPNETFTLSQLDMIVRAYFISGIEIPVSWLEKINSVAALSLDETKHKEMLLVSAALLSGDARNSSEKLTEIYKILEKPQNNALKSFENIIENIDSRTGSHAKVRYVYEKGFDTAANKSYTMPPADLMQQLSLSSDSHATGETVLLSNLILQGIDQRSVYPGIIANVSGALSEVGLGKQAQRLLAEVVLSSEK